MEIPVFEMCNVGGKVRPVYEGLQTETNVEMSNIGAVSCSSAAKIMIDSVGWEERSSKY
jgi:hypothetical protein